MLSSHFSEVEHNLASIDELLASHTRLSSSSSPSSTTLQETQQELLGTLSLLEADLDDLDESVRVVESTGDRWGIDETEVQRRRGFVERVKGEVQVGRGGGVELIDRD